MYACMYIRMYVLCMYVCMYEFANSSKSRPNSDSKIEDAVHMTTDIVHAHWHSDHVFTADVSARQTHVKSPLACVSTLDAFNRRFEEIESQPVSSTFVARMYLTHRHFIDKRAYHWQSIDQRIISNIWVTTHFVGYHVQEWAVALNVYLRISIYFCFANRMQ
jgi:hypothetical protein